MDIFRCLATARGQNRATYISTRAASCLSKAPESSAADAFDSYEERSRASGALPASSGGHDIPEDHPGSWYTWLVQDQRFVDERPDVLTWQTDELADDVTLAGQVTRSSLRRRLEATATGW